MQISLCFRLGEKRAEGKAHFILGLNLLVNLFVDLFRAIYKKKGYYEKRKYYNSRKKSL
jgi:hypothetical protein